MIVLDPRFPAPDRTAQTVNRTKSADGVIDIGWCEGVLSDGRPFRAEMWAQDQISMLTFFFGTLGLEALGDGALFALVEKEGLVRPAPKAAPSFSVRKWSDPSGAEFWSVNVVVGTEDETRLAGSVPVSRYAADGPNSVFRR